MFRRMFEFGDETGRVLGTGELIRVLFAVTFKPEERPAGTTHYRIVENGVRTPWMKLPPT